LTFLEDAGKISGVARIARVVIPGTPHHITQRGNRRMQTFFCDEDYQEYMAMMSAACRRYEVDVWERDRNNSEKNIVWQFTTPDARIKLKRLYPKL